MKGETPRLKRADMLNQITTLIQEHTNVFLGSDRSNSSVLAAMLEPPTKCSKLTSEKGSDSQVESVEDIAHVHNIKWNIVSPVSRA